MNFFKTFQTKVLLNLAIITILLMGIASVSVHREYIFALVILLPTLVGVLWRVFNLVNKTNSDLSQFLMGIQYNDFEQGFATEQMGDSHKDLYNAFNLITDKFRHLRSEQEVQNQLMQTIISNVDTGIFCTDKDGKCLMMNAALKQLLHKSYIPNFESLRHITPNVFEVLEKIQPGERTMVKETIQNEISQIAVQVYILKIKEEEIKVYTFYNIHNELSDQEVKSWQKLIRFLAHEIMYSDDDSYIYKGKMDYYVYYEPETGRLTPLEFDGNSTMNNKNVNWDIFKNEDNVNYPLLNRLLSIPSIRQRYLAHVRTILDEEMNLDEVFTLIDTYVALIDASVNADPKKIITYSEFKNGITDLKKYFTDRKAFLEADAEVNVSDLKLSNANFSVNGVAEGLPYSTDQMNITVTAGTQNVSEVNLYYAVGIVGNFTKIKMIDNGSQNDGSSNDGVYGATIPSQPEGNYVRYYMEVIKDDTSKTASYLPIGTEHSSFVYRVQFDSTKGSYLVINEVLAANDEIIADEMGEFDDYIELFNKSSSSISLNGYFITDDIEDLNKFPLPNVTINANGYYLIWADKDEEQGVNHANFKLNAGGEELYLVNSAGEIIDALSFTNQTDDISYGRFPNGTGDFETMTPTPWTTNTSTANVEFLVKDKVSMYPNPASNIVNIKVLEFGNYTIEVYNVTGKKVYANNFTGASTQINTNNLSTGTYFVSVNNQIEKLLIR